MERPEPRRLEGSITPGANDGGRAAELLMCLICGPWVCLAAPRKRDQPRELRLECRLVGWGCGGTDISGHIVRIGVVDDVQRGRACKACDARLVAKNEPLLMPAVIIRRDERDGTGIWGCLPALRQLRVPAGF